MSFAAVLSRLAAFENPFPGLRPFDTAEGHLFFGRDQQVLDLAERLQHHHFVAVLGLSGSGKSSLVRAGLIPAIQRGRLLEVGKTWRVVVAHPSDSPFANLAAELNCTPADLRSTSHGLIDYARHNLQTDQEALLVVIDQFEELFRYKGLPNSASDVSSEAAAFIGMLLASSHSLLPIYIVITMRTDYLGDCAAFPDFPEILNESQYLVPRLTREQRRQAIEGPLGLVRVSSALVERILNDAGDEPDQLPILQHALMRTWSHWHAASPENTRPIDNEDYDAVGGFAGALNQHADELLKTPPVLASPAFVPIVFKRLTALDRGNRERRSPARLSELWELCGASDRQSRARLNALIDVFRQGEATFLAPREGDLTPETYVDIAHESLIRNWKVLSQRWLTEEERQSKTLIELFNRALGWRAHERDLLSGLDLSGALQWNHDRNPASVWADHYIGTGNLSQVQQFLAASRRQFRRSEIRNKLFVAFLIASLIGSLVFAFSLLREEKQTQSLDLANRAESQISLGRSSEAIDTAQQALKVAKTGQALAALAHSFPQQLITLKGHAAPVFRAVFSTDGRQIATASGDHMAIVWDTATGQLVAKLPGHSDDVHTVAFSPDGRSVVTASADRTARVWDIATRKAIAILAEHTGDVTSAAFSPNGQFVVTSSADYTARLWDAISGQPLQVLSGHTNVINSAAFSPDGKLVATASRDKTAIVWDAATGHLRNSLQGHSGDVKTAVFSPDGQHVLTASADSTARIWSLSNAPPVVLAGHTAGLNSAAFSPDGKLVVTASDDREAIVWNASNGQPAVHLSGHFGAVNSAVFSSDSRRVITASHDGTAHLWDASTGALLENLTGHSGSVYYAAVSPSGLYAVSAGEDNTARLWNIAEAVKVIQTASNQNEAMTGSAFSPDGSRAVTSSADGTAQVWNVSSGQRLLKLIGHAGTVNSVRFSPDGRHIVTAGADRTSRVWDASSGNHILALTGHTDEVNSAVYSPDGTHILTASSDHTARIWDAQTARLLISLVGHRDIVYSAAYSPDGQRIATASQDKTARIWNAQTGELLLTIAGHTATVWTASFSPDGKQLLTASDDGSARIWDAATGQPLRALLGHNAAVYSAYFSPDGKTIATASYDTTVRLWNASTGQVIAKLQDHSDSVNTALFSQNGSEVVTASYDGTSVVFQPFTLRQLTNLLTSK